MPKEETPLNSIDAALAAAAKTKTAGKEAFKAADQVEKIAARMGKGQPKKKEEDKATHKVLLYFNDKEIRDIEEAAEINGFSKKDKNKYVKSIVRKMVRAELRQFS